VPPDSQLTPRQLFRLFDGGSLSREQLREALQTHARELIEEMEDVHANPQASWLESMINKHRAARLVRQHGEPKVREILLALSEVPNFRPAQFLWNADHADVPLHCFLRSRREPLFQVLRIVSAPFLLTITVEHGSTKKGAATREMFTLERDRLGQLVVVEREVQQ
jgi:hypothetical protein